MCATWKGIHHQRYQIVCRDAGRFTAKVKKDGTRSDKDINWPGEVQRHFNTAAEQWRTSGLASIDSTADKFQKNLTVTSKEVMSSISNLRIHHKTRVLAEIDWKEARGRVNTSVQQFRSRAKETFTRSHERLLDIDTMGSEAAVTLVMEKILNEVEPRFFEKCAKGRLRAKKFNNTTKGHHKRMWEFVQDNVASETFIHDVADCWYKQTLDDLRSCIDTFVEEAQQASESWVRLMDMMVPVTEQLTPEAEAGRRRVSTAVPALRGLVEELGRAVLIEEEIVPRAPRAAGSYEQAVSNERITIDTSTNNAQPAEPRSKPDGPTPAKKQKKEY